MIKNTLLDQFEALPELRESEESSSGRARGVITKKINALTAREPAIESILESLDRQRERRDEIGKASDFRHVEPLRRMEHMAGLRHTVLYFAERAFSLPIDYRVFDTFGKSGPFQGEFESIVIQPEYLSDDFLIGLGLMSEEDISLSQGEKIEKKITLIPIVKALLTDLSPLDLQERKTTGRIAHVRNPENPNFGKYIVFQEVTDIEADPDRKRRRKILRVIPKVYDDTYSLMRGQHHALESLEKKKDFLSELKDEVIPEMLLRWQRVGYTDDEKKGDIATLTVLLEKSLSYNERRALEDRVQKIDLRHPERDRMKLIGACNDLMREMESKIEKHAEIWRQLEWIRAREKSLRKGFEHFYDDLMGEIGGLNAVLGDIDPTQMSPIKKLEGIQTNKLKKFWQKVHKYMESPSFREKLGAPFHEIARVVSSHAIRMQNHIQSLVMNGAIGREGLHITLSLILALKEIRYAMILSESRHRIRVRGEAMSEIEQQRLRGTIEKVVVSLRDTRLLPHVDLRERGRDKFEAMIASLEGLFPSLDSEDQ